MQDEHFIREWNQVHGDFAADLDDTITRLGPSDGARSAGAAVIGTPYDRILDRQRVEPSPPALSPAARASLRGLAASVLTFGLWVTVMLAATPAPGLASPAGEPATAAAGCITAPVLA